MVPEIQWDMLTCKAGIDYLSLWYQGKVRLNIANTHNWTRVDKYGSWWRLTVQNPTQETVHYLMQKLGNPRVGELEISVDLWPLKSIVRDDIEALLLSTFKACACRFRPEDASPWGCGVRGGLNAANVPPEPFHCRVPGADETLIYAHRGDWLQSKLYYKRTDERRALPLADHRIRIELTLRRYGVQHFGLEFLENLLDYPYRRRFAKHFCIIKAVRVRGAKRLSARTFEKKNRKIQRAWNEVGIGKFAVHPDLPPQTGLFATKQITDRAKKQIAFKHYVRVRDQVSNAKIGDALKQLQRQMACRKIRTPVFC